MGDSIIDDDLCFSCRYPGGVVTTTLRAVAVPFRCARCGAAETRAVLTTAPDPRDAALASARGALLRARNALERYGRHDADCDARAGEPCGCGLRAMTEITTAALGDATRKKDGG